MFVFGLEYRGAAFKGKTNRTCHWFGRLRFHRDRPLFLWELVFVAWG